MKLKFAFIFSVFLLLSSPLFSFSKSDFSLSIAPYFSVSKGQLDEYIYSSADEKIVKSLLEWELNPLYEFGAEIKAGFKNFYLKTEEKIALPLACGTLCDSDWNSNGTTKIIYSELDEKNSLSFSLSAETGYDFSFEKSFGEREMPVKFSFTPAASFDYSYFKIKSGNGHGYFGGEDYSTNGEEVPWNSEYATCHKTYGINLTREYFNFFTGLRFGIQLAEKFDFSFGAFISPFTYVATYDRHLRKKGSYHLNGYQNGYFEYLKFDFELGYKCTSRLQFILGSTILKGNVIKGDFYHNYYSSKPALSSQKSGSGTLVFNAKLGFNFLVL